MTVLHRVFGTVLTGITGAVPGRIPAAVLCAAVTLILSHNDLLSNCFSIIITGK
jgi:hypothetical protein